MRTRHIQVLALTIILAILVIPAIQVITPEPTPDLTTPYTTIVIGNTVIAIKKPTPRPILPPAPGIYYPQA